MIFDGPSATRTETEVDQHKASEFEIFHEINAARLSSTAAIICKFRAIEFEIFRENNSS